MYALQVCLDNSSGGGNGGSGGGSGGAGGIILSFTPQLKSAETMTLTNTTLGDFTYCLRYVLQA